MPEKKIDPLYRPFSEKQRTRIARKLADRREHLNKVKVRMEPLAPSIYDDPAVKRPFTFSVKKGFKEVKGIGQYHPEVKGLKIESVYDPKAFEKGGSFSSAHEVAKNKAMDPKMIRGALGKISKMFPKAEFVGGERVTGARGTSPMADSSQVLNLSNFRKLGRLARKVARRVP